MPIKSINTPATDLVCSRIWPNFSPPSVSESFFLNAQRCGSGKPVSILLFKLLIPGVQLAWVAVRPTMSSLCSRLRDSQ